MANYPQPIVGTGLIKTGDDIFDWWKASFIARDPLEGFGIEFSPLINSFPTFPFNRGAFYSWVDNGYGKDPSNVSYYTYATPGTGWDNRDVSHWGTIKSFEFALFGNVSNGGNTSSNTLSKYVSGDTNTMGVAKWTHHDMVYMRYAFRRFDSYGECISIYDSGDGDIGYPLLYSIISSGNNIFGNHVSGQTYSFNVPFYSTYNFLSNPSLHISYFARFVNDEENNDLNFLFTTTSAGTNLGTQTITMNKPLSAPDAVINTQVYTISPDAVNIGGGKLVYITF